MATFRPPPGYKSSGSMTHSGPLIPPKLVIPQASIDFESGGAGSDVSMTVSGLESLAETLRLMGRVAMESAGYEMDKIGQEIIKYSQDHFVPFRLGGLRDSGQSDEYKPSSGANITQIAMWFGAPGSGGTDNIEAAVTFQGERFVSRSKGPAGPSALRVVDPSIYAREQHENNFYHHSAPPDQTGWKYLERAVLLFEPSVAPRIANAVGIAWGTGYTTDSELETLESALSEISYPGYGGGSE